MIRPYARPPPKLLPSSNGSLTKRLDAACPRGRTAIERAEIGRQRKDALSGIEALAAPAAATATILWARSTIFERANSERQS